MLTALRKKDYKKAIPLAQELYAKSPRWIDHWNLGRYLLLAGRVPDAGERAPQGGRAGTRGSSAWVSYISYLATNGKLGGGTEPGRGGQDSVGPDRAALPLAECLLAVGETAQAESLVVKALKEKPDDPATLRFASMFYLTQGRSPEAMKWLDALFGPRSRRDFRRPGVGRSNQGQGPAQDGPQGRCGRRPSISSSAT